MPVAVARAGVTLTLSADFCSNSCLCYCRACPCCCACPVPTRLSWYFPGQSLAAGPSGSRARPPEARGSSCTTTTLRTKRHTRSRQCPGSRHRTCSNDTESRLWTLDCEAKQLPEVALGYGGQGAVERDGHASATQAASRAGRYFGQSPGRRSHAGTPNQVALGLMCFCRTFKTLAFISRFSSWVKERADRS